jgi:hypothetical protein
MKVYALPDTLPVPEFSFDGDWQAREEAHRESVRKWIKDNGYTGPASGKVLRLPYADGYAEYMLADGKGSFLFHLPYGDGYDDRNVNFLPKKEVLARIEQQERMDALFNRNKGQAA